MENAKRTTFEEFCERAKKMTKEELRERRRFLIINGCKNAEDEDELTAIDEEYFKDAPTLKFSIHFQDQ